MTLRASTIFDELFGIRLKSKQKHPGPRVPTDKERASWFTQGNEKEPIGIEEMRRIVWFKNPVRMRRVQKDYKWLQKQLKKAGKNPEDARWLL